MAALHMPLLRRRRIGLTLRKLREQQNLTLEQVADQMDCSGSKISRIENGHSSVGMRDVRDLLHIYGVNPQVARDIMDMAREARRHERERDWWHPYNNVLVSAYVGNEHVASRIRTYEHQSVPGLFQTRDYAMALFRAAMPAVGEDVIGERLRVRMARQALLTREGKPLRFDVVIDEAVLSRPVGGDEVMRAQMRRLIDVSEMGNVRMRLLPFEAGAHAGMEGTFAILDFPEADGSSIVYAETATGGLFLDKAQELSLYEQIFGSTWAMALDENRTRDRIAQLIQRPRWVTFRV
ncbi:helix-turn-helix domain-containing protein [Allorhizocola rhizosphaerae]|uniref:helix-turn-helix domain-containing protein n=1 Tax=Allorhizocola rhizosphaerae TaxID=1872709 RepID=UPI001FE8EFB2|nr:helix-turn-helix transcriptional regulator [Allorhizocola rhizosphaerae]